MTCKVSSVSRVMFRYAVISGVQHFNVNNTETLAAPVNGIPAMI